MKALVYRGQQGLVVEEVDDPVREIALSDARYELICQLKDFNYNRIYNHPFLLERDESIAALLRHLFHHLTEIYLDHGLDEEYYLSSSFKLDRHFWHFLSKRQHLYDSD